MARIKCKGTALKQSIASVYTSVAQIIEFKLPSMKSETYEADTLDNTDAGIPYDPTGRTEGGELSGSLFLDPKLAGHKSLLALMTTPASQAWKIVFADASATEWSFTGAGFGLGGTVSLKDGLKADFSIKLSGLPTFPA